MLLGLSLKLFWRELKSGQLSIMFFALVLAVATVSSISLFTDRLEKALLAETQEFLGGDLKFESNDLIEDNPYEEIQKLNLKSTEMVLFASMLASGDNLQLASVKDGFNNNTLIRIPFPEDAKKMKATLLKIGMANQIKQFEKSINRSAE